MTKCDRIRQLIEWRRIAILGSPLETYVKIITVESTTIQIKDQPSYNRNRIANEKKMYEIFPFHCFH